MDGGIFAGTLILPVCLLISFVSALGMIPGRHILPATPHSTPQHFLRLKMLGINICFKGVCDDLFGFWGD